MPGKNIEDFVASYIIEATRNMVAQRMKRRKASWSKEGAENLDRLLVLKMCKKLQKSLKEISKKVLPTTQTCEIIEILSVAKASKKDVKGKDIKIRKMHIPFGECALNL